MVCFRADDRYLIVLLGGGIYTDSDTVVSENGIGRV